MIISETSRLFLCRPTQENFLVIENLWRDEKVRQFLGGIVSDDVIKNKIVELQNHWNLYNFGLCIVFEKISKQIIGLCGLHHSEDGIELSYMFFSQFWGKGFASEAAIASLDYGFHILKIDKIIAITQKANIRSGQLLNKIGMKCIHSFERFGATQCLFALNSNRLMIGDDKGYI